MDWFEAITGFKEGEYHDTKSKLVESDGCLHSNLSSKIYAVGDFQVPSLAELRDRRNQYGSSGRLSVKNISGDVRSMHSDRQYAGALFQVASQFNMLEMVHPGVTPEEGVTGYQFDHTQGPACAMAAGAATIYRNYLAPVGNQDGQTSDRQIDGLAELGAKLAELLGADITDLWLMSNGYAMASAEGLRKIGDLLRSFSPEERELLKGSLRIGLHTGCQVTDVPPEEKVLVSQSFCSALPVAYTGIEKHLWEPFARLVLEASYEATILAGLENMQSGRSNKILLTKLGGGAFGNREDWIGDAIRKALETAADEELSVLIVSYGETSEHMRAIERYFL